LSEQQTACNTNNATVYENSAHGGGRELGHPKPHIFQKDTTFVAQLPNSLAG